MGAVLGLMAIAFVLAYAYARYHGGFHRTPIARSAEPWGETLRKLHPLPWLLPWVVAVIALIAVLVRIEPPLALVVVVLLLLYMFGTAWLREFRFLMRLEDDAFPGRNDKLIWAMLLIILAPLGVWLFRSYREAHWPSTKRADDRLGDEIV